MKNNIKFKNKTRVFIFKIFRKCSLILQVLFKLGFSFILNQFNSTNFFETAKENVRIRFKFDSADPQADCSVQERQQSSP